METMEDQTKRERRRVEVVVCTDCGAKLVKTESGPGPDDFIEKCPKCGSGFISYEDVE